jgi:hypothetical protein
MPSRRTILRAIVALGIALAIGRPPAAGAQAPAGRYTPAPGAKDLKAVLFNWMWHLGMLRGVQEEDLIATLEYQGKGTIQVEGQPCPLTKYRVSTNYQIPGQRIQFTCLRPNGQTYSAIEVVSGQYAWNEDIVGAEIVPGQGKATPMPGALHERLIRLWAGPQGAPKAAAAAGTATTVSHGTGKPVVTFPIPGVPGGTAAAALDAKYMAERVVVTQGSTTTEFTYGDYGDWNNPLNKVEAFYTGRMIERRNGVIVRDLTTVETETGSVYVVMPVPLSVRNATSARAGK